jgi:polysaccharide export outer membrane protein
MAKMPFDFWSGRGFGKGGVAALTVATWLAGCAPEPAAPAAGSAVVSSNATSSAVVSTQTQSLTPAEIAQVMATDKSGAYILGPNDVLGLTVYMHPELGVPPGTANGVSGLPGAVITGDGFVSLPLIGNVQLGGMTIAQAQAALIADYSVYIKHPQVSLELIKAESLRYYLLGTFTSPGVKFPGHELPLLEALALGGSVDLPNADLYQAYVAQGAVKLPVDLHALLVDGDLSQNITLASGDSIVVPSAAAEKAYVFGAVGKPGAADFNSGSLSLLGALSDAGMDLKDYTDARLTQVRVIRAHGASAQFFVIDATRIMAGQAASFDLLPGDIVFVPPTLVATWNEVLQQLIPSLQTASLALQPFVSIRYLEITH